MTNATQLNSTPTHLGEMIPLELITRCHGTVPLLNRRDVSSGRCFRQMPTCLDSSMLLLILGLREVWIWIVIVCCVYSYLGHSAVGGGGGK